MRKRTLQRACRGSEEEERKSGLMETLQGETWRREARVCVQGSSSSSINQAYRVIKLFEAYDFLLI